MTDGPTLHKEKLRFKKRRKRWKKQKRDEQGCGKMKKNGWIKKRVGELLMGF